MKESNGRPQGKDKMHEHIDFSKLETDAAIDPTSFSDCSRCREGWEAFRFLRTQLSSLPQIEPNPFFSKRVLHALQGQSPALLVLIERFAKRLVPVFATLIVVTLVLFYWGVQELPEDVTTFTYELFEGSDTDTGESEASFEFFVQTLGDTSLEEISGESEQ